MNKKTSSIIIVASAIFIIVSSLFFVQRNFVVFNGEQLFLRNVASVAIAVKSPFLYRFSVDGTLNESSSMEFSTSPYWALNSGGQMILKDGVGNTIHGELSDTNKWRVAYSKSNPVDTDNGYHPQNIFRLLTRSMWMDYSQEAYFKVEKTQMSKSLNRNASNGILLMSRYVDNNNLYYAGIRVDGNAVIKKKIKGVYYTMASKKIFFGTAYERDINPNLIPNNMVIGIKSETVTLTNGQVVVRLYTDIGKTGTWTLALESIDDNQKFGGSAIKQLGYAGIRTDFMDVSFDDYQIVQK